MKHVVFYSGGLGSWATAKIVIDQHGLDNTILVFTDTRSEDKDLYRFMLDSIFEIYSFKDQELIDLVDQLPDVPKTDEEFKRKRDLLEKVQERINSLCPFKWIADGRDIWQVYEDNKLIPNNRWAKCTVLLKKHQSALFMQDYPPGEAIIYLGMDWTEAHRTVKARANWEPYLVEFPLCEEETYKTKDQIKEELAALGIELPRLYKMGFAHNNCAGFCCRAGQGHFAHLYKANPEFYKVIEEKEKAMQEAYKVDVTILKRTKKGVTVPLSLETLRQEVEEDNKQLDLFDIGGCGCFID